MRRTRQSGTACRRAARSSVVSKEAYSGGSPSASSTPFLDALTYTCARTEQQPSAEKNLVITDLNFDRSVSF